LLFFIRSAPGDAFSSTLNRGQPVSQIHFTDAAASNRTDEAGQAVRDASAGGMVPGLVRGIPFILGDDGA
jgi:hypothetical protein